MKVYRKHLDAAQNIYQAAVGEKLRVAFPIVWTRSAGIQDRSDG